MKKMGILPLLLLLVFALVPKHPGELISVFSVPKVSLLSSWLDHVISVQSSLVPDLFSYEILICQYKHILETLFDHWKYWDEMYSWKWLNKSIFTQKERKCPCPWTMKHFMRITRQPSKFWKWRLIKLLNTRFLACFLLCLTSSFRAWFSCPPRENHCPPWAAGFPIWNVEMWPRTCGSLSGAQVGAKSWQAKASKLRSLIFVPLHDFLTPPHLTSE